MTDRPATRQRGSLPGLALVVGLLALLIADTRSTETGAVIAFFVAAGAVILLFVVLLVAGSSLRRRAERSSPESVNAASVRPRHLVHAISFPGDSDGVPVLASRRTRVHPQPVPNDTFIRAVDELLAAIAWRSPGEQWAIEGFLAALTGADAEERARVLLAMDMPAATSPIEYEIQKFRKAMYVATEEQQAYLAAVLRARRGLR